MSLPDGLRRRAGAASASADTPASADAILKQKGPLDVAEQRALVDAFQRSALRDDRRFRTVFAVLAAAIAALFAYFAAAGQTLVFDAAASAHGPRLIAAAHAATALCAALTAIRVARFRVPLAWDAEADDAAPPAPALASSAAAERDAETSAFWDAMQRGVRRGTLRLVLVSLLPSAVYLWHFPFAAGFEVYELVLVASGPLLPLVAGCVLGWSVDTRRDIAALAGKRYEFHKA